VGAILAVHLFLPQKWEAGIHAVRTLTPIFRSFAEYFLSPEHNQTKWSYWRENPAGRSELRIAKLTPEPQTITPMFFVKLLNGGFNNEVQRVG
jgi:hypothetical protein